MHLIRSLFMSMNGDSHRSWELNSSMPQCTCWIPRRLKESTSVLHVRQVSFLSALLKSQCMCSLFINVRFSPSLSEHVVAMEVGPVLAASIRCCIDPWWSLWHSLWALNSLTHSLVCQTRMLFLLVFFHFLLYFCFISFSSHI